VLLPTSSVRKYAGAAQDAIVAGRELRVEAVLEGNIQRVGNRIRATVQLVSVRNEAPLWAEKFDVEFRDLHGRGRRLGTSGASADPETDP